MTMFDIGTELENASVAMRRADDIWEIFLEDMEQDLEQMDDNDSWVQYMRKRFGRAKSLLEAATERAVQAQIEKQLEKAVSKALDDIFKDWK